MRRKSTPAELNALVSQAQALTAQECQSWHPRGVRCQLEAGHQGAHTWRYVAGSRPWFWTDAGETSRPSERRRR